jgi:ABC-type thiamin/hydroxymethylpyrimidine transport system permease subunit
VLLTVMIAIHIAAGLTAVIAGLTAMLAPKQAGRHPRSGHVFLVAIGVVFATALGIVAARPHTAYLLIPGSVALLAAATGFAAHRIRWRGWLRHHFAAMGVAYIALLTAFYVDNGPKLPPWNLLPRSSFWILPAAIGLPLITRALLRYSTPRPTPAQK